eukprot:873982-Pleurochrysis_carterae.AAC.2
MFSQRPSCTSWKSEKPSLGKCVSNLWNDDVMLYGRRVDAVLIRRHPQVRACIAFNERCRPKVRPCTYLCIRLFRLSLSPSPAIHLSPPSSPP